MPITSQGWEMHITRKTVQTKSGATKKRTVGTYQVFHDGLAQTGKFMSGTTAESKGPGKNKPAGNGCRVETGRYRLSTQDGSHYKTIKYSASEAVNKNPKPGFLLRDTGERGGILVHPGKDAFLSSIGCINPCTSLPNGSTLIDYKPSRARVIALIDDMKVFVGASFPADEGHVSFKFFDKRLFSSTSVDLLSTAFQRAVDKRPKRVGTESICAFSTRGSRLVQERRIVSLEQGQRQTL